MNYLFYRGAERLWMESGLHPVTTMREQVRARRNLSAYTREGETRMESGAQPQPYYQAQDQLWHLIFDPRCPGSNCSWLNAVPLSQIRCHQLCPDVDPGMQWLCACLSVFAHDPKCYWELENLSSVVQSQGTWRNPQRSVHLTSAALMFPLQYLTSCHLAFWEPSESFSCPAAPADVNITPGELQQPAWKGVSRVVEANYDSVASFTA